jgi:hypothetical protein
MSVLLINLKKLLQLLFCSFFILAPASAQQSTTEEIKIRVHESISHERPISSPIEARLFDGLASPSLSKEAPSNH